MVAYERWSQPEVQLCDNLCLGWDNVTVSQKDNNMYRVWRLKLFQIIIADFVF